MVAMLSDIGNIRKLNEDYVDCFENEYFKLYIIADGMGGHNAGEVASKIAVETTINMLRSLKPPDDIDNALKEAIIFANSKIHNLAKASVELGGMGTTITACLVIENRMYVANVGDSRCYVVTKEGITKVTKDHSLVQQLIDEGSITEEQARKHPNKNIITRALGTNESLEVDIITMDTTGVEKVILCTDGLSNEVTDAEMLHIIKNNPENPCEQLVDLCKSKGGRDNVSVIVF